MINPVVGGKQGARADGAGTPALQMVRVLRAAVSLDGARTT